MSNNPSVVIIIKAKLWRYFFTEMDINHNNLDNGSGSSSEDSTKRPHLSTKGSKRCITILTTQIAGYYSGFMISVMGTLRARTLTLREPRVKKGDRLCLQFIPQFLRLITNSYRSVYTPIQLIPRCDMSVNGYDITLEAISAYVHERSTAGYRATLLDYDSSLPALECLVVWSKFYLLFV